MVLGEPVNGDDQTSERDLQSPNKGEAFEPDQNQLLSDEIDSTCSTPYVSAPSSPGRGPIGYFFSAPASPMHFILSSSSPPMSTSGFISSSSDCPVSGSFEFEFSARFPSNTSTTVASMISADELFLNGKIRPMKLSSHLQRPQILGPLLDVEIEDEDEGSKSPRELEFEKRGRDLRLRNRSQHRRTRSLSPLRNAPFQWRREDEEVHEEHVIRERDIDLDDPDGKRSENLSVGTTPSVSASSSRSSSSGRSSKRWIFLKDFLYRSKSEGRGNGKEKFWHSISFSPAKEKKPPSTSLSSSKEKIPPSSTATAETQKPKRIRQVTAKKNAAGKPANGVGKRRIPLSPHELHYTANRAQAEEMKKKTFLPYRQGLLGCLGFSSKGYGAMNGLARTLNPVSSR